MIPPPLRLVAGVVLPPANPVVPALLTVAPRARSCAAHIAGTVAGARLAYPDLNAFAWWQGGGHETRGPRVMFGRRGLSGGEDNGKRKQ